MKSAHFLRPGLGNWKGPLLPHSVSQGSHRAHLHSEGGDKDPQRIRGLLQSTRDSQVPLFYLLNLFKICLLLSRRHSYLNLSKKKKKNCISTLTTSDQALVDSVAAHPGSISYFIPHILHSAATIISFHCKYVYIMIPLETH